MPVFVNLGKIAVHLKGVIRVKASVVSIQSCAIDDGFRYTNLFTRNAGHERVLTLERANGQIKSTGTWWVLISKCKG